MRRAVVITIGMAVSCGAPNKEPTVVKTDTPAPEDQDGIAEPEPATPPTAPPKTLVTAGGECRSMFVHGGEVFWFAVKMWDDATLYKIPLSGGQPKKVALVNDEFKDVNVGGVLGGKLIVGNTANLFLMPIGGGFVNYGKTGTADMRFIKDGELPSPSSITTDGKKIYWTMKSGGAVSEVSITGEGAKNVDGDADVDWADQIMLIDSILYWVAHKTGGTTSVVVRRDLAKSSATRYPVPAHRGVHLDVAGHDMFVSVPLGEGKGTTLSRTSSADGKWQTFHTSPHVIADLVVYQDQVYVLAADGPRTVVQRIDVAGGQAHEVASLEQKTGDAELVISGDALLARNECNILSVGL